MIIETFDGKKLRNLRHAYAQCMRSVDSFYCKVGVTSGWVKVSRNGDDLIVHFSGGKKSKNRALQVLAHLQSKIGLRMIKGGLFAEHSINNKTRHHQVSIKLINESSQVLEDAKNFNIITGEILNNIDSFQSSFPNFSNEELIYELKKRGVSINA